MPARDIWAVGRCAVPRGCRINTQKGVNMMNHDGMMSWMMGGMFIWSAVGILLIFLLVVVIAKLLKK